MGLVRLEKASNVAPAYFLITIIQKITEAESVKKHWCKLSARFMHNNIPESDGGYFSRWQPFTAW